MKKAVLVLMVLAGLVGSIFAETKVRQFDECTTIVYDTDGNTLKSCYGIIENFYKMMYFCGTK